MFGSRVVTKNDLKNKKVLVRVDFNVPLERGVVCDSSRITNAFSTIKFLKDAEAKIILLSHLGKTAPSNQDQSLRNILSVVASEYKSRIVFIENCFAENVRNVIENAAIQDVILVENLRFYPEEEKCDLDFAKYLANLGDFYINEAFSASHRKHASIFAIPKFLPHAFGLSFANEIRLVDNFFNDAMFPKMCIIGGAKLSTKVKLLKNLVKKVNKLALGSCIAGVFLSHLRKSAQGARDLDEYAEDVSMIMENSHRYNCKLIMPVDFLMAEAKQEVCLHAVDASEVVDVASILDIGPRSIELFKRHIEESRTVLWNGPIGLFEKAHSDGGTRLLAQKISRQTKDKKLISIVCGGDTVFAMNKFEVSQDLSYVSTAGGAFLTYLEGSVLPGISAMTAPYVLCE